MIEFIQEFIMAACIGIACATLLCSLSVNWMDEEFCEECGVKF